MDSVLSIWKPTDWTSFDVVKKIRNQINTKKVGHAGTLDPFAEGVLILCTGVKTKTIYKYMNQSKEYYATIKLGYLTDTLDSTGTVISTNLIPKLNKRIINQALKSFIGRTDQEPPFFSALKYYGLPLYKYAREGVQIKLKPRQVLINNIDLISFTNTTLDIKVECAKGVYIRSLARDIAFKLDTCGHLVKLIRTKIGDYNKSNSIHIDEFNKWLLLNN
tara:strand:- start:1142 stop:1798 length:657 start_codon:yes stop_codon:yes gene_type:complete